MTGADAARRGELYDRLRPLLFRLGGGDPEVAHRLTVRAIGALSAPGLRNLLGLLSSGSPDQAIDFAGVRFPGPVGLAAGMDKYAHAVKGWQAFGFGHVELGTVTAHSQPGNEKPRLFRLPESAALINRMGFNNPGSAAMADRLVGLGIKRGNNAAGIPVGISLGKSKITPVADAVADYVTSFDRLAPHADYIAVNVSSPNTPGLRSLQDGGALAELLGALVARAEATPHRLGPLPILVKIAPDLTDSALAEVIGVAEDAGAAGLIATNTTLGRDAISAAERHLAEQSGGLSGAPLTVRAREVVGFLTAHSRLPVIGVGGILTGDDARAMFDAGASMLQLYSGFIYGGPALVGVANGAADAAATTTLR